MSTGLRARLGLVARAARLHEGWPSVLMVLAVAVPAVCALWFMGAAMSNEGEAARQRLSDAYQAQLVGARGRMEEHWGRVRGRLEGIVKTNSASAAFGRAVGLGLADGLVVYGEGGEILYPNGPAARAPGRAAGGEGAWERVEAAEFVRRDYELAAKGYLGLAAQARDVDLRARAIQAAARCFVKGGDTNAAVELVDGVLGGEEYRHALDGQGRVIAANADLMVLELMGERRDGAFAWAARRLEERLNDYEDSALAAPQRRFLMGQFQRLVGGECFGTLEGERLAAEFARRFETSGNIRGAAMPGVWELSLGDGRGTALFLTERLAKSLESVAITDGLPEGAEVVLLPPGADHAQTFVTVPAGEVFPGWSLALVVRVRDATALNLAARERTVRYLWTGTLVVIGAGMASVLATRSVRRRVALARLKNDLVATVTHELKTPLASMRVLIDTLLDCEELNEKRTREYLQLMAAENQRLSRLIQSFLTFARCEQRKQRMQWAAAPASAVLASAAEAVRERFSAPGCHFEVEASPDLPKVVGDHDALATALINLLENAWKYSGDIKHIALRAKAAGNHVLFEVQDNGIGIAAREVRRIFQPFYQVDERLSRHGSGCGLGLSIVQSIVRAHGGSVSVTSEPGRGSTFTVSLPAAARERTLPEEAIA